MNVVNDTGSLQKQFEEQEFERGIVYPLALNPTEKQRLILMARGFISPTVATVYLFLAFANALVWVAVTQ